MTAFPRLDSYRIEALIGKGGMGDVYKAWDPRLERWVAAKRLRCESDLARDRFRREARLAARLRHPAIVQIHEVVEQDQDDWLIMEWVEGSTLRRLLLDGPMEADLAADYGRRIAEGLAAAHEEGVVHRDLKTENVVALPNREIRILDFGLAKEIDDASLSHPGRILGTPRAMSPEQARGEELDARSDLFSLGVLLYELLTARSPFQGPSLYGTLQRVVRHRQSPVRRFAPDAPEILCELVDRLLEKDPQRRPASAAWTAEAISSALAGRRIFSAALAEENRDASSDLDRPSFDRPSDLPASPYPVLLPVTHPALFAGRRRELDELRKTLRGPQLIVLLCAASGAGKSSLLLAGLLPALRAARLPISFIRNPEEAGLAGHMTADLEGVDLSEKEPSIRDRDHRKFRERLDAVRRAAGEAPVLILDQFEQALRSTEARSRVGPLLASSAVRRPGDDGPPCRWVLAVRKEFQGKALTWLRDVLAQARRGDEDVASLPHDLSDPRRLVCLALPPLAARALRDGGVDEATRVFEETIVKPLQIRDSIDEPVYPQRFAPGHARRLAGAFARARAARPEAPLMPELQVVLAFLTTRSDRLIHVPENVEEVIETALKDHLRRSLKSAFPSGRIERTRALLALHRLTTPDGRRGEGLSPERLAAAMDDGARILHKLSEPPARLITTTGAPEGLCCNLAHDRLARAVVELVEEEDRRGGLLVDGELLALKRIVDLKSTLFDTGERTSSTHLPSRQYRRIRRYAETLLRDSAARSWWAACESRRRTKRARFAVGTLAISVLLFFLSLKVSSWSERRAEQEILRDRIVDGAPAEAFVAIDLLRGEISSEDLVAELSRREYPGEILEQGLGGLTGEKRRRTVFAVVEALLPRIAEDPYDFKLLASVIWALEQAERDPSGEIQARELHDLALASLRDRRPPPEIPRTSDPDWIEIPAGSFEMGTSKDRAQSDRESPRHRVDVAAFRLLRREVANAEYRRMVPEHEGRDDFPAAYVDWYGAVVYAAWRGGRLPNEAEWEYAARADCTSDYCDARGETDVENVAWTEKNFRQGSQPVMRLEPNAWGLYDMLGNQWEWTTSWYAPYPFGEALSGRWRVGRGGSFQSLPDLARPAYRAQFVPDSAFRHVGFRMVLPSLEDQVERDQESSDDD